MGLKIALGTGRIETIGRSERKVKIRWSVSIESEA
jgi:hypothetical protein